VRYRSLVAARLRDPASTPPTCRVVIRQAKRQAKKFKEETFRLLSQIGLELSARRNKAEKHDYSERMNWY
jgi:hypothetical protein